jgi:cell division septum initiation protein DivIVA
MQKQEFDEHPLWNAIDQTLEALLETEDAAPPAEAPARERIRFVAVLARSYKEIDPALFSRTMIDAVHPLWAQAAAYIGQSHDIPSAVNQVEATLVSIGAWPQPVAKGGAAAKANRLFNEYVKEAERVLDAVKRSAEQDRTHSESERLRQDSIISQMQVNLDQLTAQLLAQTAKITADETRLDTALNRNNETFIAAQTTREEKYQEWLNTQEESFTETVQPYLNTLKDKEMEGTEHLQALEDLRDKTEKVAGDATGAMLARDYGSYSRREWISGVVSYVGGFSLLVATAAYLLRTLSGIGEDDNVSWQFVSLKLGATVTGAGAAAVAFGLGARFLHRANLNKRVELELRAIGPFLADVDDVDALKKAKTDFIDRSFGHAWEAQQKGGKDSINVSALESLLTVFAKFFKNQ